MGCGVKRLEFGMWGLWFGFWVLGFGVWGFDGLGLKNGDRVLRVWWFRVGVWDLRFWVLGV